jgi:hypothetical protein
LIRCAVTAAGCLVSMACEDGSFGAVLIGKEPLRAVDGKGCGLQKQRTAAKGPASAGAGGGVIWEV